MIDDPTQARRLARAICTDISLYTQVRELAPSDATRILTIAAVEGLQLYTSRVTPQHVPLFEEAVIEMFARMNVTYAGLSMPPPVVPTVHPPVPDRVDRIDREPERRGSPMLVVAIMVALVVVGAAAFFLLAR